MTANLIAPFVTPLPAGLFLHAGKSMRQVGQPGRWWIASDLRLAMLAPIPACATVGSAAQRDRAQQAAFPMSAHRVRGVHTDTPAV
jgi:hypothetical protein